MKEYIGNCVSNPFDSVEILSTIIENGKKVSKKKFLGVCDIYYAIINSMKEYPQDYEFYKSGEIYFYVHSAIEYFFK